MNAILVHCWCLQNFAVPRRQFDLVIEAPLSNDRKGITVYCENEDSERAVHNLHEYWISAHLFPDKFFFFDMTLEEVIFLLGKEIGNFEIFECQCRRSI